MSETQRNTTDGTAKYQAPTIADYGDLVELTAAAGTGGFFDQTYPAGYPASGPFGYRSSPLPNGG